MGEPSVTDPAALGSVSVAALIELLESRAAPSVIAFDADGTLWSGDVSEDVFAVAVAEGRLREPARGPLAELAMEYGLSADGDASALAARVMDAHRAGAVPELVTYEMMTWCYAGISEAELTALAARVLDRLDQRIDPRAQPLIDWARAAGHRVGIVSASPAPIVRVGAARLGFAAADVVGAEARSEAGRLAATVPYGPAKRALGVARFGEGPWLAAFGDSPFDVELLGCARFGVAVSPKRDLTARLAAAHPRPYLLAPL